MTFGLALRDARWFLVALLLVATGAAVGAAVSTAFFYANALPARPEPPPVAPPEPCREVVRAEPPPAPEPVAKAPAQPIEALARTIPVLTGTIDGERLPSNGRVVLRRESGTIAFGNARSAFRIRVGYSLRPGAFVAALDSEPPAMIYDGDAMLGQTPVRFEVGRSVRKVSFRRPGADRVWLMLQSGAAVAVELAPPAPALVPAPVPAAVTAPPTAPVVTSPIVTASAVTASAVTASAVTASAVTAFAAPAPAARSARAPAAPPGKTLLFKTALPTPVRLDGKAVKQMGKIALVSARGTLVAGDADSPYVMKLEYAVADGVLTARFDSEPWAIAYVDGVSKGKVPVTFEIPDGRPMKLDLRRPGDERELTVILKSFNE